MFNLKRPEVSTDVLAGAIQELIKNLDDRIRQHGRGAFTTSMEGLGVVTEEYHELVEACRTRNLSDIFSEASDVAVGCLWLMATIKASVEQPEHTGKKG